MTLPAISLLCHSIPCHGLLASGRHRSPAGDVLLNLQLWQHASTFAMVSFTGLVVASFSERPVSMRLAGANLEVDVPWKYLNFFLDDDEELAEIGRRYSQGDENMMSGHVKKRLAEVRGHIE